MSKITLTVSIKQVADLIKELYELITELDESLSAQFTIMTA